MARLRFFTTSVGCMLLACSGPFDAHAADVVWTGWLGPARDGWVRGFQPPDTWPEKLRRGWSVTVGTGYGTSLVVGDRVFQHARQGEDEVVWCLDLSTGEVEWQSSRRVPFKVGSGGERHGKGPKSCPVYADGRLFTLSITGTLAAWNAETGERLWQRNYDSEFGKSHPYWGASTSPIVDDGRVIVHFGTDQQGALVALDVATGKEVWRHGNDGPSYSSPLIAEVHGVKQVIEWNHQALVGVESSSGKPLWEHPFPHVGHNQNMPTPAFHAGRVLLGGENRGVFSFEPQLSDGAWFVDERWRQTKVALDMSSAVINDELLYGMSHYGKGRIFCLEPKSGDILWQSPGRTGENVTFLSVPGYVLALNSDGRLRVVAARRDKYDVVASYRVAESDTWAPPVLLADGILIKDRQALTWWSLSRPSSPADAQ